THEHEPLVLIPRRERRQINGFLRFMQPGAAPEVILHPFEAKKAEIEDGDPVTIRTVSGQMRGLARLDVGMRLGAVSVPHAWRNHSVNDLLSCDNDIDGLTGMPLLSGVAVTISKAG
ncbi:MAG: molybdopterin dinucleotide binding domain-containing protein, partial [Acidimicrobiales bacterium]